MTPRPPVTPHPPKLEEVLPICPPVEAAPILEEATRPNLLLVSTLDGQLSALDLSKVKFLTLKVKFIEQGGGGGV